MRISKISIAKLRIPLIRPFITALRRTEQVEDVVVIVETDSGLVGYGSAASTPVITGDSTDSIIGAVQLIGSALVGADIRNFAALLQLIRTRVINNTSAKAALDIAVYDLISKSAGLPLYKFLGGGIPEVKILSTVSVKDCAEMVADAKLFVSQGFETLKIKVGLEPREDIVRLKAIRQAVGDKIQILSDANQGWDAKSALNIIDSLVKNDIGIAMVEQPVKAWDIEGLKYIRDNSRLPIYADEAVFSVRDATKIIAAQAADGLNIKLMKAGGLAEGIAIYDLATAHNIPCMAGCMLESPIGLAAMASMIVGRSNIKFIDLDPITMIKTNPVVGGVTLDGATLHLTEAPGLGITHIDNLEILTVLQ